MHIYLIRPSLLLLSSLINLDEFIHHHHYGIHSSFVVDDLDDDNDDDDCQMQFTATATTEKS
ncbi:hypothetical protein DERP_010679 [Dermatophagoides pteronyssinus]|uniref:Uncharacterized protein n=1 Tax=Dermatophagoides pteronyssinus TaxID=6956 RepID=A0ABQ8JA39_DERPT|nr:hypothetical protein DERP_010679 [Dermatophagoides pteronyssinus]